MDYRGTVKLDRKTKNLIKRLKPGDIAVIDHKDIDEVAARSLAAAGIKVVINANSSISGRYPNPGPTVLKKSGIVILDRVGSNIFDQLREGDQIEIKGNKIFLNQKVVGEGELLTEERIDELLKKTRANLEKELEKFVENTLQYAKKEKSIILGLKVPEIKTSLQDRHVLIVVRGQDYQADLRAIQTYITEIKPVIIGVDGGADACLELDLKPDIIIGDMDSVSDRALKSGAELVVHAYPDGRAPGMERLKKLGLNGVTFPAPGTSEDIAMLLAYEHGASLIVAVGTHSNIIDFLEKGRPGMASTFLTRMKIGSILVDARGVSKLYRKSFSRKDLTYLVAAALIPILIILLISPPMQQLVRLLVVWFRLTLGI
ncbi:thiamine pyrophosphokinase [Anoxybacter fermentans]|uniref:Thiamine pyrophosphokinase n=1 Tax=Anoxybacter fermentans TaxID=1323375 RepID=A0A3Q9HQQ7_9FIRM|nr:putative cytokinetic ring protein SteA [Anoxybacter fermentans]AZR73511.1 thiamine pyrophosphokinase [Anoxybacter fermentans]